MRSESRRDEEKHQMRTVSSREISTRHSKHIKALYLIFHEVATFRTERHAVRYLFGLTVSKAPRNLFTINWQ